MNATVFFRPEDDELHPYDTRCREVRPRFISEDHLVPFGCGELEVISAAGARLFGAHIQGESGLTAVARGGSRIAIFENSYTHAHRPTLKMERFTVFDVKLKGIVSTMEIKELRGRKSGNSGVALSPDGLFLAINSLGIVRFFALPTGQ